MTTGDAIVCRKCGGRVFIGRNRCVRCGEELVLVAGVGAGADLESIDAHIARDDDEQRAKARHMRAALEWISTHDLTTVAGCRRAQTVAAYALRGLPPPEGMA